MYIIQYIRMHDGYRAADYYLRMILRTSYERYYNMVRLNNTFDVDITM